MAAPIEFWFDFSSPYGYLGAQKIDALAARYGRTVDWRPMLLGAVFKRVGTAPLVDYPLKGEYAKRDIARSARFHGVKGMRMPSRFPIGTQVAARLVVWQKGIDAERAVRVAKALFRAYWADDVDISVPENAIAVAAKEGVDAATARAAIEDPAVKDALKRDVDEALAKGVFGSPYVIVDGEPFWGIDHFDQVEKWLATGGF